MRNTKIKILIIDDHALFADGLSLILKSLGSHIDVSISNGAARVLNNIESLLNNDLILIDLHMPSMDGFGFLSAVRVQKIPIPVGVISGTEKKSDIERAIGLGAQGFIPKDSPSAEMLKAISLLLNGKNYLPQRWLGEVDFLDYAHQTDNNETITERQRHVLELMKDGLQNKQIATVLGISVSAVKGHIENIFKTMGVNNRTACVQVARERGLI
jgi:DNA-binding NarL/FixJ family response regulator